MFVKNFELIGSASNPAAAFSFSSVVGETFMV
nr:Rpn family recombination-promoting nuclease/putative transposase [Nostoc sp. PA-18-2419]